MGFRPSVISHHTFRGKLVSDLLSHLKTLDTNRRAQSSNNTRCSGTFAQHCLDSTFNDATYRSAPPGMDHPDDTGRIVGQKDRHTVSSGHTDSHTSQRSDKSINALNGFRRHRE